MAEKNQIQSLIDKGVLLEIESGSLITHLLYQQQNENGGGTPPVVDDRYRLVFEFYVYDIDSEQLLETSYINVIDEWNKSIFVTADKLLLNPGMHLRSLGYSAGVYKIRYKFYKNLVGSHSGQKLHIKRISPSRTEIELIPPEGLAPFLEEQQNVTVNAPVNIGGGNNLALFGIKRDYMIFRSAYYNRIKQLKIYLNLGFDKSYLIINAKDPKDLDLLLKLYQPLVDSINSYDECWICEELIPQYNDTIALYTENLPNIDNLIYLRKAVVNYDEAQIHFRTTPLENFDTLVTPNRDVKNEIVRQYLSSSLIEGIELNVDYRNFNNFVKFSSIQQRLINFRQKVINIEFYESKVTQYYTGSIGSASVDTPEISSSIDYFRNLKQNTINEFDNYERYLYYKSSSYESSSIGEFYETTWPKYTNTQPYLLYSYTSSQAQQWYSGMTSSASIYDNLNKDLYSNFVPLDMQLDNENKNFVKFISMIGHYLDVSNIYIKEMPSWHYKNNSIDEGIPKDLIIHAINHYGFDLRSGQVLKSLNDYIIITGSDFDFTNFGKISAAIDGYGFLYGENYGYGL